MKIFNNSKDIEFLVYFLLSLVFGVMIFLLIRSETLNLFLAIFAIFVSLVGLVLIIKHRQLQEIREEETYLQNRILYIEEKIEFYAQNVPNGIPKGYDAIQMANRFLKDDILFGDKLGQFYISIPKINALVIHLHYLTKLYEQNSHLHNRCILFFHTQFALIDQLKELFEMMNLKDPAKYNSMEWDDLHQMIKQVQDFKETQ